MLLSCRSLACVGLDLDGSVVRGVLVCNGKEGAEVLGKAERPLPAKSGSLGEVVAGLIDELDARGVKVVVGLGDEEVFVRSLRLPDIPRREIDEAVRWELEPLLPGKDKDQKYITRHVTTGKQGNHLDILAAAVSEEVLRERYSFLATQVPLAAADLRACALWRFALYTQAQPVEGALAVIESNPSGTRVVIGDDYLQFAREIPPGANFALEMRRTINFYQSQYNKQVTRVLTAGSELIPGLGIKEAAMTGEPPLKRGFDEQAVTWDPEYAVALGLALYYTYEPRLDLLPDGLQAKNWRLLTAKGRFWLAGGLAGLLLLTLPLALTMLARTTAHNLERELTGLRPVVQEKQRILEECRRLEEWIDVVQAFNLKIPSRALVLDWASSVLPGDAWLITLQMGSSGQEVPFDAGQKPSANSQETVTLPPVPANMHIEGYSLSAASVGAYRDNLARLAFFNQVQVIKIEWDEKINAYQFTLEAQLKAGEGK